MTTLNQAVRTFNQRRATQAALQNEQMTRERVEVLERSVRQMRLEAAQGRAAFREHTKLGFWGRVKWLLLGR